MPPNPPTKRVASPRAAWRFAPCKYPHFSRKILNPPRNEILDTPLSTPHCHGYTVVYYMYVMEQSSGHLSSPTLDKSKLKVTKFMTRAFFQDVQL